MEFRSLGHGTWQLAPSSLANEFRPEIRTLLTWARVVEYEFQNRTPNKKRYSFNEKVRGFHGCIYTYYIIIYIIYIYTSYLYIYISSYGYSWPGNSWLFCGSMWLRKVPLYLWLPCGLCFDGEAGELSKLVTAVSGSDSLNLADWQQKYAKKKRISFTCFSSFADVSRLWPEGRCLTDVRSWGTAEPTFCGRGWGVQSKPVGWWQRWRATSLNIPRSSDGHWQDGAEQCASAKCRKASSHNELGPPIRLCCLALLGCTEQREQPGKLLRPVQLCIAASSGIGKLRKDDAFIRLYWSILYIWLYLYKRLYMAILLEAE